jgi:putative ABC transport system permease protein
MPLWRFPQALVGPRRGTTFDTLALDLRYAVRRLLRDRGFTLAAVAILAVGIAANTATFSLVNAALFREQPVADPARLVDIYQRDSNQGGVAGNSYPAYRDMAEYTDIFASTTAAVVPNGVHYRDDGAVRAAVAQFATATYLQTLGLRPSLGRWFTAVEDTPGAEIVGVVGHRAWIGKFGADPSIVGRTIRIEGVPVTIVGVGPAGHNATLNIGIVTDFWLPISAISALGGPPRALERRPEEAAFFVKARLRDGVTVAQAQAAMDTLGKRLASEYPNEDPGGGISVFPSSEVRIHPQLDTFVAWLATVLMAVVAFVLAIACSNLATLLLVRGAARAKEVSIRLAMGATGRQVVRHLLTESLLLSAAGGAAGCIMAWWAIRSFSALDLPIVVDLSLDYRVLTFAVAISLITGLAFGLAPALETARIDLVPLLRDAGEARSSDHRWLTLKNALVVFQVALSVVLLGGTSIFLQMVDASRAQRVGFAIDGVAMLETDARYAGYSAAQATPVCEEIRRRVAAIPGVQSAVVTRGLPMQTTGMSIVTDRAPTAPGVVAGAIWAGPGYFDTLRLPILYGRGIDERDRRDTPRVAVINETMARQSFGAVNAVGRRFRLEHDANVWFEVVGVARDTGTADLQGDLVDPTSQLFYRSFTQSDVLPTTIVARTRLDAASLIGGMQREMRSVNDALPIISSKTMAQSLEDSLRGTKTVVAFLAGLSALGLCLAGIGLYALVSFVVSRRSREIGIRMALGARSQQVVWTVTGEVAALVTIGTVAGLGLSMLAGLALRAAATPAPGISLYRPSADPVALLAIAAFMAVVGLAAASIPAWRAARIDPLNALRRD